MCKIISVAQNMHHIDKSTYKQNIKMWLRQICVLVVFIIFSKVFEFEFEQRTIYLLGIVSVIATCANYGQSILERKNYGIYEYILGVGINYNILLEIEVIDFWIVNFKNFIFLIISNTIFWFAMSLEIEFGFFFYYGILVISASIVLGVLVIQSSLCNKNAPYWMSFSIFIVIIVLMLLPFEKGIEIILGICVILNIICYIYIQKTKKWIYKI